MERGDINRWSDHAIENLIEEARVQQATQISLLTSAHTRTRFSFGTGLGGFILAIGTYDQSGTAAVTAWWIAAGIFLVGLWGAAANLSTKDLVAFNDVLVLSNQTPPPSRRSLAHAYLNMIPQVSDVITTRMYIYRSSLRLMLLAGAALLAMSVC
ncbi:hypothetical protein [Candidatus Poriferisodalis sp.]|uniref:hypothetical protein n=1 Tax=Candidatus Poriferisodalis sp. TaxID=3101277 RepID=UPI003B022858